MAKKVLYLGNSKWCYTESCQQHSALILAKNNYIHAVSTNNGSLLKEAADVLLASEEGKHALRHTQVRILKNDLGRQPNIGLDLDGTTGSFTDGLRNFLAAQNPTKIPKELWAKHYPNPKTYDYHGPGSWFKDREEFAKHFQAAEADGIYTKMPIYPGASKTLNELKNYGFNIKVVTARRNVFNKESSGWLKTNTVPFRKIFNPGHAKEDVPDVDIYMEDAPVVIERLIANEKKVLVMNQEYNEDIADHPNLSRTQNWDTDAVVGKIFDLIIKK